MAAACVVTSCFSSGKLREDKEVDTRAPMVFGTLVQQAPVPETKAVLPQGFKVNTWKSFGSAAQQTVMDGFKVDYTGLRGGPSTSATLLGPGRISVRIPCGVALVRGRYYHRDGRVYWQYVL